MRGGLGFMPELDEPVRCVRGFDLCFAGDAIIPLLGRFLNFLRYLCGFTYGLEGMVTLGIEP